MKIRYVEAGRGDAVVLIHGFASSLDGNWRQNGVFDALAKDFHAVIPVTAEMTDQARTIMDDYPTLMARDALHAAACRVAGADAICSYDADLDVIAWLRRIEPGEAE